VGGERGGVGEGARAERVAGACHKRPRPSRLCFQGQGVNSGIRMVTVMRVFVAGGAGVIGPRLVPQLVARGHQVTATTSPAKLGLLEELGAKAVVMDGLDARSVGEAVARARPDAIVHEMTGLSGAHAGKVDMKHFDRWFATTNRLRTEGTDHLLAAAEATGVSHVVAQSYAGWNGIRTGGWVKTEEDRLDPERGTGSARERRRSATSRRWSSGRAATRTRAPPRRRSRGGGWLTPRGSAGGLTARRPASRRRPLARSLEPGTAGPWSRRGRKLRCGSRRQCGGQ